MRIRGRVWACESKAAVPQTDEAVPPVPLHFDEQHDHFARVGSSIHIIADEDELGREVTACGPAGSKQPRSLSKQP